MCVCAGEGECKVCVCVCKKDRKREERQTALLRKIIINVVYVCMWVCVHKVIIQCHTHMHSKISQVMMETTQERTDNKSNIYIFIKNTKCMPHTNSMPQCVMFFFAISAFCMLVQAEASM